jgi:hypothetical protein
MSLILSSMSLRTIIAACLFAGFVSASQQIFSAPEVNTAENFIPIGTLDVLSEHSFTALTHPEFPAYGVRIKKTNFCDEGVG